MKPQNINSKKAKKKCATGRHIGKHLLKAFAATVLMGLAFWLLWNWAGVALFTFPSLTYLQALAAILMTGFLVRICMFAAGRHRGSCFNHPAHAGCLASHSRSHNGPRDN